LATPPLVIGSAVLICLLPLAMYMLLLGWLNQRRRPSVLSGSWDFTCLLLGLSGFIVLLGPMVLTLLDSAWRNWLFSGRLARTGRADTVLWSLSAGMWLLMLSTVILWMYAGRKRTTAVYNIEDTEVEEPIRATCEKLGMSWRRTHGIWLILPVPQARDSADREPGSASGPSGPIPDADPIFMETSSFAATKHLTLHWTDNHPRLRRQFEEEFARHMLTRPVPANPAGSWCMTAGFSIIFFMLLTMGMISWYSRNAM